MKHLISLLAIVVLFSLSAFAGDIDTVGVKYYYQDTLTATLDTMDIAFTNPERFSDYSIQIYATSGADTINVYTLSKDGNFWTQVAMTDLSSGSAVTQIITSTTPKEFVLLDPQPNKIRLICADAGSASSVFVVCGKYQP
jgi:hypothetical protein